MSRFAVGRAPLSPPGSTEAMPSVVRRGVGMVVRRGLGDGSVCLRGTAR